MTPLTAIALALAAAAVAAHGGLLWYATVAQQALSLGSTASLTGWLLALLGIYYVLRSDFRGLGSVLLGIAGITALFTAGGQLPAEAGTAPLWQFVSHALMATLAYSLLAAAALLAFAGSLKDRRLRHVGTAGWTVRLPSLDDIERHMFACILAGFALLSLAIFSGLIFVRDLMAQHLAHKTVLASLAWVIFGVLLLGRWQFGWRGRKATTLALVGFALLLLAYFGSRFVLEMVLGRQWG
ncbi:MAG: cytochrome c biogenesis protein CcsA [Gammaproteobacteria bacterium]|nr:cytochrome c biogenesis protein CcsA [Gammaproteobacteria bacterium]NNF61757.1 cytochrome c biogenesis protein CcsA [Gammaproteobacteria bacterium]NNM20422.1 cytochrome c biogenesis protein CcsA [Gammaproteobacteria bacterium]